MAGVALTDLAGSTIGHDAVAGTVERVIDYKMSYPSTNDSDYVYEFLENHL